MVLLLFALFRAGLEPLLWERDHGLSLRIEGRFGFLGRYHNQRRSSKPARLAWQRNRTLGAPSFSPYRSRVPTPFRPSPHRRVTGAPIRPFAFLQPTLPQSIITRYARKFGSGGEVFYCRGLP